MSKKTTPELLRIIDAWEPETVLKRLIRCKSMLYMHGYLTDSENRKCFERLEKRVRKEGAK